MNMLSLLNYTLKMVDYILFKEMKKLKEQFFLEKWITPLRLKIFLER